MCAAGSSRKRRPLGHGQLHPARDHSPHEMAVSHQHDVAVRESSLGGVHHHVGSGADHLVGLAARAGVGPHRPMGDLLADLGGGQALELAVVPLGQRVPVTVVGQPGERCGDVRPASGAGDDERIVQPSSVNCAPTARAWAAPRSVRGTSVVLVCRPRPRPLGLPVSQQNQSALAWGHGINHAGCARTLAFGPRVRKDLGRDDGTGCSESKGGVAKTTTVASLGRRSWISTGGCWWWTWTRRDV